MAQIIVCASASAVGEMAAAFILREWQKALQDREVFVLGLATGSTPVECYHKLVGYYISGTLTRDQVERGVTFNLDEYAPPPEWRSTWRFDEQSYWCFMYQHLFSHLPFRAGANHLLDPAAPDLEEECRRFEQQIKASGGIDLQLLGIGTNGHVGFAEPGSPAADPQARTQLVRLSLQTVKDNAAKFFDGRLDQVPKLALSMGLGTILDAKTVLLLATGASKATAVAASMLGPVTRFCPASFLQSHPRCTYLVDEEAAGLLLASLAESAGWSGGERKPGRYSVRSEAEIEHVVDIEEPAVAVRAAEQARPAAP